jgi:hypothetical protein
LVTTLWAHNCPWMVLGKQNLIYYIKVRMVQWLYMSLLHRTATQGSFYTTSTDL